MLRRSRMPACHLAPLAAAASALLGCSGPGAPPAQPPLAPESPALPPLRGATTDSMGGLFDVEIILEEMRAEVEPVEERTGQFPQGRRYDLDIANFLTPDSFQVKSVRYVANDDVLVTFTHAHPFPAPQVAEPALGPNRADLGYTGRLLILADLDASEVPAHTWYGGEAILNEDLVVFADGYANPGDLLLGINTNTNTYPYVLLVNELFDNRVGVSNGGTMQGSYDPAQGGWQLNNLAPEGTGWTGYDYLHAGQAVRQDFTLSRAMLEANAFRFQVALLIQYTDPQGQPGRQRRFPVPSGDPLEFAYRLPYAALDASKARIGPAPFVMGSEAGSSMPIEADLRDWDAGASEAADFDLSDEPDVTLIQPGASGAPEMHIDIPGMITGPFDIPATGEGTGLPDDEIEYADTLINALGMIPPGNYTGLARWRDPEVNDVDRLSYHFGLDPVTIVPDASRALAPVTYLPFDVTVESTTPITRPNWQTHPVADAQGIVYADDWSTITSVGGRLAIAFCSPTSDMQLFMAMANVDTPVAQTDWTLHTVDPELVVGRGGSMLTYNGQIAIAYADYDNNIRIARATEVLPNGPEDYVLNIIPGGIGWENDLTEVGGLLTFVSKRYNPSHALVFGQATTATPSTAADWTTYPIDTVGESGYYPSLSAYDTGIVAFHYDPGAGDLRFVQSTLGVPTSAAQWSAGVVEAGGMLSPMNINGRGTDCVLQNGALWVAYPDALNRELMLAHTSTTVLSGPSDFTLQVVDDLFQAQGVVPAGNMRMLSHSGRLAIAYCYFTAEGIDNNEAQFRMARALVPSPDEPADWDLFTVAESGPMEDATGYMPGITVHNGNFATSHRHIWINASLSDGPW